jgi:hypothetical protein
VGEEAPVGVGGDVAKGVETQLDGRHGQINQWPGVAVPAGCC